MATSRIVRTIFACSSCLPCEKFRRKASTPEVRSRSIISSLLLAGPSVARIFVRRIALMLIAMKPILVADLFAPLNEELVALLRSLTPDEWKAPTVAGAWTVKDVAAHLLDTALRRLAWRDAHTMPGPFEPNRVNREWIDA